MSFLGEITLEEFLHEYWQKKPLLIRNAFPDWKNIVEPDELAGLALEEFIESRLLLGNACFDEWQLEHGPFQASRFSTLGDKYWTLLVQGVDQWVEPVADLLDEFRFAPNWRVDDVMISYAVDGGSVGPHFDNYDVFLIQGLGQRRWQVGGECGSDSALQDNEQLKILSNMVVEHDWVLNEGDMLYLPPRFSHWGRAIGESMTYSVGFTAPSNADVVGYICNDFISRCDDNDRYSDPDLSDTQAPGEITADAIEKVQSLIQGIADDKQQLARAFGEMMTEPKNADLFECCDPLDEAQMLAMINTHQVIAKNTVSRISYYQSEDNCLLFVDGQSFVCTSAGSIAVAQQLADCGGLMIDEMKQALIDTQTITLLIELFANDSVEFIND